MYTYSEIFRNKNEGRKIPSKKRKKRDANHRLSMIDYAPSFVRGDNVAMDVVIEDDRRPIIKIEREIEIERG